MTTENIIENSEEMEEDNDDKTKELDQQLMVQFTSETGNLYSKLSNCLFKLVSCIYLVVIFKYYDILQEKRRLPHFLFQKMLRRTNLRLYY